MHRLLVVAVAWLFFISQAAAAYLPSSPPTSVAIYTSTTATLTLPNVGNLIEEIAQTTPAAITITLNATGLSNGFTQCVKDKSNNFATYNATIKTSDGSTIDTASGSTGYKMTTKNQFLCFVWDGSSNWLIAT